MDRFVMEPQETYIVAGGRWFTHKIETDESYFTPCTTECPAPVCSCGYFRLEWPMWEAIVAARQAQPVQE